MMFYFVHKGLLVRKTLKGMVMGKHEKSVKRDERNRKVEDQSRLTDRFTYAAMYIKSGHAHSYPNNIMTGILCKSQGLFHLSEMTVHMFTASLYKLSQLSFTLWLEAQEVGT